MRPIFIALVLVGPSLVLLLLGIFQTVLWLMSVHDISVLLVDRSMRIASSASPLIDGHVAGVFAVFIWLNLRMLLTVIACFLLRYSGRAAHIAVVILVIPFFVGVVGLAPSYLAFNLQGDRLLVIPGYGESFGIEGTVSPYNLRYDDWTIATTLTQHLAVLPALPRIELGTSDMLTTVMDIYILAVLSFAGGNLLKEILRRIALSILNWHTCLCNPFLYHPNLLPSNRSYERGSRSCSPRVASLQRLSALDAGAETSLRSWWDLTINECRYLSCVGRVKNN